MSRDRLLVSLGRLAKERHREPFEPLDEAACDRIAAKLAAKIHGERARSLSTDRILARRRALARLSASAAVLAVAAAATGLVVGLQKEDPAANGAPPASRASIPDYQIEVTGGDVLRGTRAVSEPERSDWKKPTLVGAGASLTVVLRPARPAPAHAAMIACLLRDGVARPWSVAWSRSEQGSFLARGPREVLFAGEAPGDLTLLFAVRPEGALPACADLARSGTPLSHAIRIL